MSRTNRTLACVAAAAMAAGAAMWASRASASSDAGCFARWSLEMRQYDACSSTTLMGPATDTRVMLLMLLHDRFGAVGASDLASNDYFERRGDARPYDYAYFASRLASGLRTPPRDANAAPDPLDAIRGTVCQSSPSGAAAFVAALNTTRGVPDAERRALSAMRDALTTRCINATTASDKLAPTAFIRSAKGRAFLAYWTGAQAFYDGNWVAARAAFTTAAASDVPWVREAGTYMLGRSEVNRAAETSIGEYGTVSATPDGPTLESARQAERDFSLYFRAYPDGRYATSARGLLRRVHYLAADKSALLDAYIWQFNQIDPARRGDSLADLVQEIDIRLLNDAGRPASDYAPAGLPISAVRDPMLLAVLDIKAMRQSRDPDDRDYDPPVITREQIGAQRPLFAGQERLYDYVRAAHAYYVEGDARAVTSLIGADTLGSGTGFLDNSRRLLRAMALARLGDGGADAAMRDALALATDQPMQRATAELALALYAERHGGVDALFATGSPVADVELRERMLRYAAGADLLRRQAASGDAAPRERATAAYILFYKQLTRGLYADFVRDHARIAPGLPQAPPHEGWGDSLRAVERFAWPGSSEFACPSISSIAQRLATAPRNATAQLCLGEFIRLNRMDPSFYGTTGQIDERPGSDALGGGPDGFAGQRWSRLSAYRAIIADPAAPAGDRAYALYRAVNCFAPSGNNGCDAATVPIAERRAWFQALKTRYRNSPWADRLEYYW